MCMRGFLKLPDSERKIVDHTHSCPTPVRKFLNKTQHSNLFFFAKKTSSLFIHHTHSHISKVKLTLRACMSPALMFARQESFVIIVDLAPTNIYVTAEC